MSDDFFSALGDLAECIHRAGDEIRRSIGGPADRNDVRGYRIDRNGAIVGIVGAPGDGHFQVTYEYNVANQLAAGMDDGTAETVLTAAEHDHLSPQDARQVAARKRLAAIADDEATLAEVEDAVRDRASGFSVAVTPLHVEVDGQQVWAGIQATKRLYPSDPTFGARDYDETVGTVADEGAKLASTVAETLDLLSAVDAEQGLGDGGHDGEKRGFQ